ncbi:TEL2, telomere maintenance protein 2 [Borealophlyctis nickersoniae]|nr:TEL2, telomere maintenance protein 2 [Borealophlyctis nickersoniae]
MSAEDIHQTHITSTFISGMGTYLESSVLRVRELGMVREEVHGSDVCWNQFPISITHYRKFTYKVTAECFSKASQSPDKLDFELEENDEIRYMRFLASPASNVEMTPEVDEAPVAEMPATGGDAGVVEDSTLVLGGPDIPDDEEDPDEFVQNIPGSDSSEGEGDSDDEDDDDDLEPYAMPSEVSAPDGGKILKPPVYIRDCLQWLRSEEDPDKLEISLKTAEKIIRRTPTKELEEFCSELCLTLLNLQDNYDLEGFVENRMAALTSLVVQVPTRAPRYLINYFYERNYSISQRLDVLACLGLAAMELGSSHKDEGSSAASTPGTTPQSTDPVDEVTERIRAKTRRFSRKSLVPAKKTQMNRFASVASGFFFPLVGRFQDAGNSYNIFEGGAACRILQKFISTAAIVLHCAANTPDTRKMARELFDLVWALRYLPYNSKGMDIQAELLFAISVILTSLPSSILFDEFGSRGYGLGGDVGDIGEIQRWIAEIFEKDPNQHVIKMCASVLAILKDLHEERQERFLGPLGKLSLA